MALFKLTWKKKRWARFQISTQLRSKTFYSELQNQCQEKGGEIVKVKGKTNFILSLKTAASKCAELSCLLTVFYGPRRKSAEQVRDEPIKSVIKQKSEKTVRVRR